MSATKHKMMSLAKHTVDNTFIRSPNQANQLIGDLLNIDLFQHSYVLENIYVNQAQHQFGILNIIFTNTQLKMHNSL